MDRYIFTRNFEGKRVEVTAQKIFNVEIVLAYPFMLR